MKPAIRTMTAGILVIAVMLLTGHPAQAQETCDENPGAGYTQTISGMVDGDIMQITVSERFGGSVDSVTWRGKEFINIFDHGRQISYAWSMDFYGECFNPTEPGSAHDDRGNTSTSELLSVCKSASNILTTTTRPAYWLGPGETGFCDSGATTAVNEELVSDQLLEKTIQIGYEGLENVIVFDAVITNPTDYTFMQAEIPTGYLTYEFNTYWTFNPGTGELISPESDPPIEPWSYTHYGRFPPIISTPDGSYAMGAFYPGPKTVWYGIHNFDPSSLDNQTNKWTMVVAEEPYPAGSYRYQSFAIVGTLEQVQEAMVGLYEIHPTDFTAPEGYVDARNCTEIDGWAWDPGLPDEPIEVAIYDVGLDGTETLMTTVPADNYRGDLADALGDNGRHGFRLPTPIELQDGELHTVHFYGVNPDPALPDGLLLPADTTLECAAVFQPTDEPTPAPAVEETAPVAEVTQPVEEPSTPAGPGCLSGAIFVALGAVVAQRRRTG